MLKTLKLILAWLSVVPIGIIIISSTSLKPALAADPTSLYFTPQIQIPSADFSASTSVGQYNQETGAMDSTLLAKYIKAFYDYGMSIAGILAALVLMGGGLLWLTSAGNDSRVTQAKELIIGSITGMVILFCSWIILNTINPDLLNMRTISVKINEPRSFDIGCCTNKTGISRNATKEECGGDTFSAEKLLPLGETTCEDVGCCIHREFLKGGYTCSESTKTACLNGNLFAAGSCEQQEKCQQPDSVIVGCAAGAKDGDDCTGKTDSHCYNKICITGGGTNSGDFCGTEKNAVCLFKNYGSGCPDPNECSEPACEKFKTKNWKAGSGGESCTNTQANQDLICCYPE